MKIHQLIASLAAVVATSVALAGLAEAAPGGDRGNSRAAKACQDGGFVNYQTTGGDRFVDEGACTSYAARGGTLVPAPVVVERSVTITFAPSQGQCVVILSGAGFAPSTFYQAVVTVGDITIPNGFTTDTEGSFSDSDIATNLFGANIQATVDGVSSPVTTVAC